MERIKKDGKKRKEGSSQNAPELEKKEKNKHFLAALTTVPWGSKLDVVLLRVTTESSVGKKKDMGQGLEAGS